MFLGVKSFYIRTLLFLWVFLVLISSCQKNWINRVEVRELDAYDGISWLPIPDDSISSPNFIVSYSSYVVWSEPKEDWIIHVYDSVDGLISPAVRRGRAENEILNVNQLLSSNGRFYVADIFKKRLTGYIVSNDDCDQIVSVPITEFSTLDVQGDTLVGQSSYDNGRFIIRSMNDTTGRRFGDYSYYGLDNKIGAQLLAGHVSANNELGRIACFSHFSCAYDIEDYKREEDVISVLLKPFLYDDNEGHFVTMSPETEDCFVAVSSSEDYIYALYDGKELKEYMTIKNGDVNVYGQYICIFDWNGNYIDCIHSELPLTSIAWNKEQGRLYVSALCHDGLYRIGYLTEL